MPLSKRRATMLALSLVGAQGGAAMAQGDARVAAAAAYDQGQRAFEARDFNAAAEFFETANRALPSAQAVIQAIRAHRGATNASHDARAATLALSLLSRYPSDTRVTGYAYRVIDELSTRLGRLQVRCQGCDLSIDQQASEHSTFVEPGGHAVVASWGERVVNRQVNVAAGQTLPLEFEPPLTPLAAPLPTPVSTPVVSAPVVSAPTVEPVADAPPSAEVDAPTPRARGVHPALFVTSLIATLGVGGALAWSAVDTLQGRDAYAQNPTQAGLDDGRQRELRTNVFIGAAAALGVTTMLVAGFTRWRSPRPTPVAALVLGGGVVGVQGSF
jgi:hypothetical protein